MPKKYVNFIKSSLRASKERKKEREKKGKKKKVKESNGKECFSTSR